MQGECSFNTRRTSSLRPPQDFIVRFTGRFERTQARFNRRRMQFMAALADSIFRINAGLRLVASSLQIWRGDVGFNACASEPESELGGKQTFPLLNIVMVMSEAALQL